MFDWGVAMRRALGALAVLVLCSTAESAEFSWERSFGSRTAHLYLDGRIEAEDVERFHRLIVEIDSKGLSPIAVTLRSPGGSVIPAIELGRRIRIFGLTTVAPTRVPQMRNSVMCSGPYFDHYGEKLRGFVDLTNSKRCVCASACFLVWSGGKGRGGNVIGVHRPSYKDAEEFGALAPAEAEVKYNSMLDVVSQYLKEFDVPDFAIRKMLSTPSNEMTFLTAEEAKQMDNSFARDEHYRARCGDVHSFQKEWQLAIRRGDTKQHNAYREKTKKMTECSEAITIELKRESLARYFEKYGK